MNNLKHSYYKGTIYFGDIPTKVEAIQVDKSDEINKKGIKVESNENLKEKIAIKQDEIILYKANFDKNINFYNYINIKFGDLRATGLDSQIQVNDNKNLYKNDTKFKWHEGINRVKLSAKQINNKDIKINIQIKLSRNQYYYKELITENEHEFNVIKFINKNYDLNSNINIREIVLNEFILNQNIEYSSGTEIWNLYSNKNIKHFSMRFDIVIPKYLNCNNKNNFIILFGN